MTLRNVLRFTSPCAFGLLILSGVGCAHTAIIESDPPGAELFVNGTQVGITPYELQDTVGSGDRYEIVIKKPGYKIAQETLHQDQFSWPRGIASVACGACTLGVGCLGLLWSWELQDRYTYVLEPASAAGDAPASQPGSGPATAPTADDDEAPAPSATVPL